jgi:hypothetical protein
VHTALRDTRGTFGLSPAHPAIRSACQMLLRPRRSPGRGARHPSLTQTPPCCPSSAPPPVAGACAKGEGSAVTPLASAHRAAKGAWPLVVLLGGPLTCPSCQKAFPTATRFTRLQHLRPWCSIVRYLTASKIRHPPFVTLQVRYLWSVVGDAAAHQLLDLLLQARQRLGSAGRQLPAEVTVCVTATCAATRNEQPGVSWSGIPCTWA